jgi:DNA-binding transcriptional ArsR family regulator
MRDFMAITKALADENRVRLLLALRKKELCLCQLIELVRLAPSTVSTHMSILKRARLVDSRKEGRWMYYRLPGNDAPAVVQRVIEWASRSLSNDPVIAEDRERLKEILKLDPSALCDRHARSPLPLHRQLLP